MRWQGIGEGTKLKSWYQGISFGMDGKKMWQNMWQDVSSHHQEFSLRQVLQKHPTPYCKTELPEAHPWCFLAG